MNKRKVLFRLEIHLFGQGYFDKPIVSIWEKTELEATGINPLLLKVDAACDRNYLFSLKRFYKEKGTAVYHPYATHENLKLMQDLVNFGFVEISADDLFFMLAAEDGQRLEEVTTDVTL